MAIHNEHLRKADESYEVRHDNNGNAIHVFIKDGEAIIFPTLWDLIRYQYLGDSDVDRLYVSEDELSEIYEDDYSYDYYAIKRGLEKKNGFQPKPNVQKLEFAYNGKDYKIVFIAEDSDYWVTMEEFDIHYSEDYNQISVYIQGQLSSSIYSRKIKSEL
jgi:hypothetical protein